MSVTDHFRQLRGDFKAECVPISIDFYCQVERGVME